MPLPFPFLFYGQTYSAAFVSTNGHLNFLAVEHRVQQHRHPVDGGAERGDLPAVGRPERDLRHRVDVRPGPPAPRRTGRSSSSGATSTSSTPALQVDVEVQLNEDGSIVTRYRNIGADPREQGNSATVGIENAAGTIALQYSFNTAVLSDAQSIRFRPPPTGRVAGTVTDANDGLALAGATVRVLSGSTVEATTTTAADGGYDLRVRLGTYTVEISKTNYVTDTGSVTLGSDGQVVTHDVALATARAEVSPGSLSFLANAGPAANRERGAEQHVHERRDAQLHDQRRTRAGCSSCLAPARSTPADRSRSPCVPTPRGWPPVCTTASSRSPRTPVASR